MPYPQSKHAEPVYLKNFDPKTFYPALAHTETLEPRADDISINPSSSISQQSIRHPDPDPENYPLETWGVRERHISRTRLWIFTLGAAVLVTIIVLVFAWLGAHNFFRDQPVQFP